MGVVESPQLVRSLISGPLELECVFTLSKTEEMLVVHEKAQTNTSVNSSPDRTCLACGNFAVNVAASDVIDLLLQSSDAIAIRIIHVGTGLELRSQSRGCRRC